MSQKSLQIVLKIQKLLALSGDKGATPAEAEAALLKAHKLMAEHNIAIGELTDKNEPIELQTEARVNPWARKIYAAVARLNFCEFYFQRSGNVRKGYAFFVGQEGNAQVVQELAIWVVEHLRKEGNKQRRLRGASNNWYTSFMEAAAERIAYRVHRIMEEAKEQKDQTEATGTALVLADVYTQHTAMNRAWIEKNVEGLTMSRSSKRQGKSVDGARAGIAAADAVNLNTQVGNRAATGLIN